MGDRAFTSIEVLPEHTAEAKRIVGEEYCVFHAPVAKKMQSEEGFTVAPHLNWPHPPLTRFEIEEANYGGAIYAEELAEACIPFDLEHAAGDEYDAGQQYLRFSPKGEPEFLGFPDWLQSHVDLRKIKKAMWGPVLPEKIKDRIEMVLADHRKHTIPRSWEKQAEYSAKARVLKLVKS